MAKPDCREGTYAADGEKIMKLREASRFKSRDDFCDAEPQISIPTLDRAESGGCLFKATLQKIARKLGLYSWMDLLATPFDPMAPEFEEFRGSIRQEWHVDRPFDSFDESSDGLDIIDKVQLLLKRRIPFLVIAFRPDDSLDIEIEVGLRDAVDIERLYTEGALAQLGITKVSSAAREDDRLSRAEREIDQMRSRVIEMDETIEVLQKTIKHLEAILRVEPSVRPSDKPLPE